MVGDGLSVAAVAALLALPGLSGCHRGASSPGSPPAVTAPGGTAAAARPKVALSLSLAPLGGTGKLDAEIARIQAALRAGPEDAETWTRLARAFVRKARESGQPQLYAQAGDAAGRALGLRPDHHGALEVQQAVLLNDHRFAEARKLAAEIVRRDPKDSAAWGTLGDAAMEVGDYQVASQAYQQMVDLKPDLRSYSRGAWMRWLAGDGEGAVELMTMAAQSGGGEPRAFCLVQLGDLHFLRGAYPVARAAYDEALRTQPGYPAALASRGRLALSTGSPAEALNDLSAALAVLPLTSTRALYIEALWAAGRDSDAKAELPRLAQQGEREDPRALSLFYSTHDLEHAQAVALARREAAARPDIYSLDALAWALYRDGKIEEAWTTIQKASQLGTRDPRLLYHRGRIAAAREVRGEAVEGLRLALAQSPRWDRREPDEARATLVRLGGR